MGKFFHLCALLLAVCSASNAHASLIFDDGFEDNVTFDVTWAPETRLIEGDDMAALLTSDVANNTFEFSTAELTARGLDLSGGDLLLVEGLALGRIQSIDVSGGRTIVGTSPAPLNEAIVDGRIGWDVEIDYAALSRAKVVVGKSTCLPEFDEENPGTVTFTCEVDEYTMSLRLTSAGDGAELEYQVAKGVGGNVDAAFTGTATLERFQSRAAFDYAGGELDSLQYSSDDMRVRLRIVLSAAGSGDSNLNFTLPAPIIKIPIPQLSLLGVTIDIGAQFIASLEVPLQAAASATAEANFSYSGTTGFSYDGGDVDTSGTINDHDFTDGAFDSASNFATVDAQFGIAFPRIGLSMLLFDEIAWAHSGYIVGSRLTFGPICKSGYARLVVEGGYGIEFLGVELASGKQTFAERERRTSQNNCAD